MTETEKMTPIRAIRAFFEKDGGKPVQLKEVQALSSEERHYLARLCAAELGVEIEIATP